MRDADALPESFDRFVRRGHDRDTLPCRECGDRVRRDRLVDRVCPGCRYGQRGGRDA